MKLDWRAALGLVLSGVLLWWTLRGVNLADVWHVLRASNLALWTLCMVVATCVFPLRARRWRTILEPAAGSLPFGPLWRSTAIGMMVNNVFPLRAGEIARAFAITREVPKVALTTSLSSLAVDRLFDAVVLLAMMFGAMLDPAFPTLQQLSGGSLVAVARVGIGGVVGLLLVVYAIVLQPERVTQLAAAVARRIAPKHEAALIRLVEHAVRGLAVLKDSRRFLAVLFWAVLHWLVNALGMYLGCLALGIQVPFSAAMFLQGVIGIGVAVPSSPGFFGVFEGGATLALAVYGVPRSLAVSWALGYHILTFIPITAFGAMYFSRLGLGLRDLRGAAERREQMDDADAAFAGATVKRDAVRDPA